MFCARKRRSGSRYSARILIGRASVLSRKSGSSYARRACGLFGIGGKTVSFQGVHTWFKVLVQGSGFKVVVQSSTFWFVRRSEGHGAKVRWSDIDDLRRGGGGGRGPRRSGGGAS